IAASGPAASVLMAAIGYAALAWTAPVGFTGLLVAQFTLVNLLLAAFNLLPGLPLDGGWILRAGLWKVTGRPTVSVMAAAWIGRLLAAGLAADLAVRFSTGSPVGLLTLAVTGMVTFQIWSGASAVLRETARARLAAPISGPGGDGDMMSGAPGADHSHGHSGHAGHAEHSGGETGHGGRHGHG
ncbi:MAG TPA: site-2 protease family protein, partial [Arthrobacter sp.]